MALIKCKECGKEISDTVKKCPYCGFHIKSKTKNLIIILTVFILISLLILINFYKKVSNNRINNSYGNQIFNLTSYTDNFIKYGDWLIFSNGNSEVLNKTVSNFKEGIYKYNLKTKQVIRLSEYDGFSFNILANKLYYISKFNDINYIDLDTLDSERIAWISGNTYEATDLFICDNYLYYREKNGKNIYRTTLSGDTKNLVAEYTEGNFQIYDNYIYYIDANSHKLNMRKINTDTVETLIDETISSFYYNDNKIIYKVADELKSINLVDKSISTIKDGVTSNFVVNDNYIYFYLSSEKSIIKISIDNQLEEPILENVENDIYRLQLFDGVLYYSNRKTDGLFSANISTTLYYIDINNKTQEKLQFNTNI